MINLKNIEVLFNTERQYLYGEEVLKKVAGHSKEIAHGSAQSTRHHHPGRDEPSYPAIAGRLAENLDEFYKCW